MNLRDQLAAGLATLGAGRLAGSTIRTAANFDQEVRRAAAIEGGAGTYDVLRQEIEKVAAAAAGTPTQVAQLSVALSRAGFTAKETTEALAGIVRGAEATSLSFEEMGSIAADNLRAFGLQTNETGRVVDVLTQTANKSNQTVLDLGESLKYAAPIARSLGVPLEDLAATMGLLANNGIRGSDAGTALRTGLTRLQIAASGSNEELEGLTRGNVLLAKAMRSLGTQIIDTRGNLLPLDQIILRLRENLQQLSAGRRAEIAKALFGDEAGSKFLALLNSSEGQIRQMFGAVRDSGGVAEDTQKKMQGFAYTLEVLKGNIEIVGNAIGDSFGVVLEPLAKALNSVIGATQSWPKPLRQVLAAAAAAGVAVTGFTLAVKAIGGITAVTAALQAVAASTTAAGTAATVATGQVTALRVALISLTKIGVITVGVSLIVNGLQELQAARSELQRLRKLREAGGAAASFPEG
ncbi:MAG: phage tail tape measure protein, partial [Gammaproteobacteria bacterium]